jgi:hypothetical protein
MQRSFAALARLGLRIGEPIRFRREGTSRWVVGEVLGIEADGSILLRDPDGSARSLRAEVLEIRRPGSRGRLRWCVVSDVAVTWEQLEMFGTDPSAPTLFDH